LPVSPGNNPFPENKAGFGEVSVVRTLDTRKTIFTIRYNTIITAFRARDAMGVAVAEPMYRVIADDLRSRIESGEFPAGEQLKTEVELREEYGRADARISRTTVRDAIKLLVAQGLVETRAGQGTFVRGRTDPFVSKLTADPAAGGLEDEIYRSEVERQGRVPDESRPRVEVQLAPPGIGQLLQLGGGTDAQVISRHQRRSIDSTPYSMQTTYYPMKFVTDNSATQLLDTRDMKDGAVEYLRSLGINQVGWRDQFLVRPPDTNERAFFNLSDRVQVAMLEVRRTGYDEEGRPMRVTVTVYPGDRNQFEMEAGKVPLLGLKS
jgi:GntR family transcriptional regulator